MTLQIAQIETTIHDISDFFTDWVGGRVQAMSTRSGATLSIGLPMTSLPSCPADSPLEKRTSRAT